MRAYRLGCVFLPLLLACAGTAESAEDSGTTASDLESEAAPKLTFGADWSAKSSGSLRAGRTFTVAYDESRAGECAGTQGGQPAFSTTGYAQLEDGSVQSFWAAGLHTTPGSKSEFTLPKGHGGDLAVWFETTNRWGCHSYDSSFGANFHFTVNETQHLPDWVGAADSTISRGTCGGTACDEDRRSLEQGFSYDTWGRQRAAIKQLSFRVWEPGLTDRDDDQLWEKLEAQVHYRVGGTGEYQTAYVNLEGRVGNDVRYVFDVRAMDPLGANNVLTERSQCPAIPLTASPDDQYVTVPVDFWFSVEGAELRAESGSDFRGTYVNYKQYYAVCLP